MKYKAFTNSFFFFQVSIVAANPLSDTTNVPIYSVAKDLSKQAKQQTVLVSQAVPEFNAPKDSMKQIELQTVEVTTGQSRSTGLQNSIPPIRVLNVEKFKNLGAQNISDVLKFSANIRISQDNVLGAGMSMMGISGENVKILVDGVPITGRQNGNIDLSQLNIANVERIEVVEGPLSVQYGTNALAGTINIIMKKKPAKGIDYQLFSQNESVGHINFGGALGYRNKNKCLMLGFGRNFFGGWTPPQYAAENPSRWQLWKPKIQYFGDLNGLIELGKTKVNIGANYFDEYILSRGKPLLPYGENAFDDHFRTKRATQSVNLTHKAENGVLFNILLANNYYQRNKNTYYRDLVNLTQNLTANEGEQDTTVFNLTTLRATASKKWSEKLNLDLGLDFNSELGMGLRIKNKRKTIGDYALFASADWQISEKLVLRPGVRYAYNTAYRAPIIPSFHAKYKINDIWTLRGSYGMGFRAPSLKELYFYFVDINHNIRGNENLKAEKSHSFNIVGNMTKSVGAKTVYKLDISTFYNRIENLISLAVLRGGDANAFTYINIGRYRTLGGQLTGSIFYGDFSLTAGTSSTYNINVFDENKTYSATMYDFRVNTSYYIKRWDITPNIWYKWNSKQMSFIEDASGDILPNFLASYQMADCGVTKKFLKNKVVLTAGIKNIFNVQNIQSQQFGGTHSSNSGASALATGRNAFVRVEANF